MFVLDTTVFILTVIRTMQMRHTMQTQAILVILFRDGRFRPQLFVCMSNPSSLSRYSVLLVCPFP